MARRAAPASPPDGATGRLDAYRAKRDFSRTREPAPETPAAQASGRRLIVQRHYATREHFDLRLEIDGVLASWAVTRGPSADPRDKRLAVRTEDHPLAYAAFEGVIPKGSYGGGTVLLWEATTYEPLNGDPAAALAKGEIKFFSHGARLRGAWVLVRMKPRPGEKGENWLLIKERDGFVETDDALARRYATSLVSGRDRDAVEAGAPARAQTATPRAPKTAATPAKQAPVDAPGLARPAFVAPMLCAVADAPPQGAGWLAEMKYDGYRLQLAVGEGGASAYTRSGLDWSTRFAGLVAAAAVLPCRAAALDGEAVVFDDKGLSDFPALVAALDGSGASAIVFVAFDLLSLDGRDLRARPLAARKAALRTLLADAPPTLRFADHVEGDVARVFADVGRAGAEGIVAKRVDAPYLSGRSSDWVKVKAARREDVVIIGFMPSTKGESFASLLAAVEEEGALRYAGRVGTGYGGAQRARLAPRLTAGERPAALSGPVAPPRGAVFLKTAFRAEIGHGGWTGEGQLRQARFLAPRDDLPVGSPLAALTSALTGEASKAAPKSQVKRKEAAMTLTHPERVVFPEAGLTKGDVAAYFDAVADRLAPYLKDRPVSILRAPDGVGAETFFQRHPLKGMTRGVVEVASEGKIYMALDGAEGLRTAAQFGAVELHGWMSRLDALDRPDRVIFDLDPHESLSFEAVKAGARRVAEALTAVGLKSWPLLSGGKGVHVVAPLDRSLSVADVEVFAKGVAQGLAADAPERFVATMSKARREGRIFIDWLRNKRGATAILPWSPRARARAGVAVPVSWADLDAAPAADAFSLRDAAKRRDGWDGFFTTRQTIQAGTLAFLRARAGG
jgi:bifunctional non-homologous end joining protein LigD